MHEALKQAQKAYECDEVPIGAVVVSSEGIIVSRGYNRTEVDCSQSRHAELCALEKAGKKRGDWRLDGCALYVTLEPCIMCMGLIALSRIERLVFGAQSPIFGYHLDKEILPKLYKKHIKGIASGILEKESKELLEKFFKKKRKET